MAKGVIVIPQIPENCAKCQLGNIKIADAEVHVECTVTKKEAMDTIEEVRPEWCPIIQNCWRWSR